ncbi:hypothetical protein DITRI_Ditri04bG0026400 [Diplodiscus trichospermus]
MEGRGECCIARYAAAGVYDMSKVDRIMLRFRPIAPKPATGGSVSPQGNSEVYPKSRRGKRRHSKEGNTMSNTKRCTRRRRVLSEDNKRVTLPLLPETPDCKDAILKEEKGGVDEKVMPLGLKFGQADDQKEGFVGGSGGSANPAVLMPSQAVRMMGSCVTVECMTETWVSGDGLGNTDEERKVNLGRDTCPGFISDGLGRVTWTNGAYKEMVGGEMMVWLVMKERLPMITYPAFTCRMRVQYTCGKEMSSLTLPCDVWRMNGGGFAWRLDINAALCLGR